MSLPLPLQPANAFSLNQIFDELIKELGFEAAEESEKETLRQNWLVELNDQIMKAVYASLEDKVINHVIQKYPHEDELFWFTQMIESSPATQLAIIEATENFKINTLNEYRSLAL